MGSPPSTAVPERSPCPPSHSLRQLPSQHCSHVLPAVGGGGCRRKEPLGKAKKIPAGGAAAAASSLPACSCSWRGQQQSPEWCCVEELCIRASNTPHTPTSTGCSCSWTSLGGCLRQIFHSCPSLPPCPSMLLPAIPAARHATAGHSETWLHWPRSANPEWVLHKHRLQG